MKKPKGANPSFKNYTAYYNWAMGKGKPTKLKNAVLQHPDETENSIYNYMQKKKNRNLWTVNFKQFAKMGMNESHDPFFDWDSVLGREEGPDKWGELEKDVMAIVDKHSGKFGADSYGVIDAIYQVMDGMFQRVDKGNGNKY